MQPTGTQPAALLAVGIGGALLLGGCPAQNSSAKNGDAVVAGTNAIGLPTWPGTATNGSNANGNGGDGNGGSGGGNTPQTQSVTYTVEPDDFANETDLTLLNPHLRLYTALDTNEPVELFYVTATNDDQGYAPTGQRVFAHFNIPFFNDDRRLLMIFDSPASMVSLQFAGASLSPEIGRLQVYNTAGQLLAEHVTAPLGPGEVEVMQLTRESANIAYALAYVADGEGSFGRMDALSYTVQE